MKSIMNVDVNELASLIIIFLFSYSVMMFILNYFVKSNFYNKSSQMKKMKKMSKINPNNSNNTYKYAKWTKNSNSNRNTNRNSNNNNNSIVHTLENDVIKAANAIENSASHAYKWGKSVALNSK